MCLAFDSKISFFFPCLFCSLTLSRQIKSMLSVIGLVLIYLYRTTFYRGGEWSFKNSESRKILVEFHGSLQFRFFNGYVRLAYFIIFHFHFLFYQFWFLFLTFCFSFCFFFFSFSF